MKLREITNWLEDFAPVSLAEDWDNVGLLLGDATEEIASVMTCLTLSPDVVQEAIEEKVNLVVTHHPLPFRPLKQITTATVDGGSLWKLARHGVAVYSPHTAFDSAARGINQQWAEQLGLEKTKPLIPLADLNTDNAAESGPPLGAGRCGKLAKKATLTELAKHVSQFLPEAPLQVTEADDFPVESVAIACGSGGSFLSAAHQQGCQALITGEATFHTCLEARSRGIALLLTGHYGSERFAVERLADYLSKDFSELNIWASKVEKSPLRRL